MSPLLITSLVIASSMLLDYGSAKFCSRPIPGSYKLSRGVNIYDLDMVPVDGFNMGGTRFPFINFQCEDNHVWKESSYDINFDWAKSLKSPVTVFGDFKVVKNTVLKTVFDLKNDNSVKAKLTSGTPIKPLPIEGSFSYKKDYQKITVDKTAIGKITADRISYILNLQKPKQLEADPYAQQYIDEYLTKPFESDPAPYEEFIRLFGTHYFSQGTFGGKLALFTYIKEKEMNQTNSKAMKLNVQVAFEAKAVSFGATFDHETKKGSKVKDFFKKTTSEFRYYGGQADLMERKKGFVEDWIDSVDFDPWLLTGVLEPLSEIIKDDGKRKNIEKAAMHHFLKSKRDKAQTLLKQKRADGLISEWGRKQLSDLVYKNYKAEVLDKLLRDMRPKKTAIPKWFFETDFCMKYKATSSAGVSHCNQTPQKAPMCAKPDSLGLSGYEENSSGKHGCSMQWGILSRKHEKWFSKTEICLRWETVGSSIKQCNNAAKGEICAPVNRFTSKYVDRTSVDDGYCKLSWRIKVPTDAPFWAYTTNFCFSWDHISYTSVNYCGNMVKHEPCARIGAWTPYYMDNTDGSEDTGCVMSWGWKSK